MLEGEDDEAVQRGFGDDSGGVVGYEEVFVNFFLKLVDAEVSCTYRASCSCLVQLYCIVFDYVVVLVVWVEESGSGADKE